MAASFHYRPEGSSSEAGENGYAELAGIVVEATDEAEAAAAAEAELPLTFNGFPKQPIRLEELGGGIWYVRAPYRLVPQQAYPPVVVGDDWLYSLDSGESTVHVTHAFDGDELRYAAVGEPDPADLKGAINVTSEGVQGVDVRVGDPRLVRRKVVQASQVSWEWRKFVASRAFRLNDSPWLVWQTREVLHCKTQIQDRNNGEVEITQEFSPGEFADTAPGPVFSSVLKAPHDYVWVEFVERADAAAKKKIWAPVALRINRLYPDMSFADLEPS